MRTLYLIDAYAQIFRAYYAVRGGMHSPVTGEATPVQTASQEVSFGRQRKDGSRSLMVPAIKGAETLDFAGFFGEYEELIRRGRSAGSVVDISQIDFLRAGLDSPASFGESAPAASAATPGEPEAGLDLALRLETVFALVAERVFPSVAGVSLFRKETAPATGGRVGARTEAWRQAGREEAPYPGYRRVRSGSGVFVSEDGFLLTTSRLLSGDGGARSDDIVDVEIQGNRHYRARIVGMEPAIKPAALATRSGVVGILATEATLAGDYFSDQDGRADWVWQDFLINGVKWKYGRIPELPLIQPDKPRQPRQRQHPRQKDEQRQTPPPCAPHLAGINPRRCTPPGGKMLSRHAVPSHCAALPA